MIVTTETIRLEVSRRIRALLLRHGSVEQRHQLPMLMAILDASYSQVYRKINGRSSWLEEDLYRIAAHFGETLGTVFADDPHAAVPVDQAESAPRRIAKLNVEGVLLDCEVQLSVDPGHPSPFKAVDTPDGLRVMKAELAPPTAAGSVACIAIALDKPPSGGLAVLDDDAELADAIVDSLMVRDVHAEAFYTQVDLLASPRRFDAYIVDWCTGQTSAEDLIRQLRARYPSAVVVVLTGQIGQGVAESELASAVQSLNVLVETKPARIDLLLAKIRRERQST